MRRMIGFSCEGDTLVGTLDESPGTTGLLIVSGGNEIRCGAHRGMALLAAEIAAAGYPVFRYDRRGIGDSSGTNQGFMTSQSDLIAAAAAFRTNAPQLTAIVGFGNCDAATALALFGQSAGIDRLVLANPWTIEDQDILPPAAAIRARYADRLRNPAEWLRLLRGGVDLHKLISGLKKISRSSGEQPGSLASQLIDALHGWGDRATVLLARADATAIAYRAAVGDVTQTHIIDSDSHSFARRTDKAALRAAILAALAR